MYITVVCSEVRLASDLRRHHLQVDYGLPGPWQFLRSIAADVELTWYKLAIIIC